MREKVLDQRNSFMPLTSIPNFRAIGRQPREIFFRASAKNLSGTSNSFRVLPSGQCKWLRFCLEDEMPRSSAGLALSYKGKRVTLQRIVVEDAAEML
jgi:hypothetical protein